MKFLWTAIYVNNLNTSLSFYKDIVGLKVTRQFEAGPGVEIAFMGKGENDETLVELIQDRGKKDIDYCKEVSIGFAVDSVDKKMQVMKDKGIKIQEGPVETPKSKFFYIEDPDGFRVQFVQFV